MGPPLKGDEFLASPRQCHPPHDPNSRKGRNNKGAITKTKERKKIKKGLLISKRRESESHTKFPKETRKRKKNPPTHQKPYHHARMERGETATHTLSLHSKENTRNVPLPTESHHFIPWSKKKKNSDNICTYLPKQIKSKQTVEIQRIILCCVRNPGKSPAFTTLGLYLLVRVLKNSCLLMLGSFFFFFFNFFFF